ncbi:unnamed protein product [Parascedosporium putredinis]|uniref:Rhodopsin domain-containing protein n=1 Tax=Parascedosporium putredinis TaxID=1442378 RepID=A0A9P1GWY5_9PEZI|nr:unnamed protein product [Parascedosporium putredinis]CAI7990047.1 unnamed protein product [Parascedosporium putredinis]
MSASLAAERAAIEDRGPAVFAVTTATLVLATVFVVARLVCRRFIVKNISWDDRIILLAWLIAFGLSFTINFGARKGLGLLRLASWVTLAIVNIAGTVLTFMNIFQCQPISSAWSTWEDGSKCIPLLTEFICASPVNIVTDLAILALPIPVLTGMNLPPRQKTILVLTFGLGVFVTIVDVVRIYYLQQAIWSAPTSLSDDPNSKFGQEEFAFNASLSLMWSAVEVNVGMTCACIPTLKPLISKILPSMIMGPDGGSSNPSATTDGKERNSIMLPNGRNSALMAVNPHAWDSPGPRARGSIAGDQYRRSGFLDVGPPHLAFESRPSAEERRRRSTLQGLANTNSYSSRQESAVYFGFVNMKKPKSMLRCSVAESWKYCTAVTVLFLLWGMSYGFLSALNNAVLITIGMSTVESLALTSIYFGGGYFFGPLLVGEWILRRDEHHRTPSKRAKGKEGIGGFKVTFIVGLCFYGVGTIVFWPSAVTQSFGGLMLSHFVVGFGLSILETGANAFLVLCGPPQYADLRLMLAQGVQAIGSVIATVLATKVFFAGLEPDTNWNSMTLINVQWTYLAITLACVILALFFYYMPLPEVCDSELDAASKRLPVDPQKRSIGGFQLRTWSLVLAVVGLWTYMAAQEGASSFFRQLLVSALPTSDRQAAETSLDDERSFSNNKLPGLVMSIPDYLLIAQSGFTVSRFILAAILYKGLSNQRLPRPRTLLAICVSLETDEAGGGVHHHGCFGADFFPFVMYAIIKRTDSVQLAYVVVAVLQFVTGVYPLFLMVVRDARALVDPIVGDEQSGAMGTGGGDNDDLTLEEQLRERQRQRRRESRQSVTWAAAEKVVDYLRALPDGRARKDSVSLGVDETAAASASEKAPTSTDKDKK